MKFESLVQSLSANPWTKRGETGMPNPGPKTGAARREGVGGGSASCESAYAVRGAHKDAHARWSFST